MFVTLWYAFVLCIWISRDIIFRSLSKYNEKSSLKLVESRRNWYRQITLNFVVNSWISSILSKNGSNGFFARTE